jgi:hypothetical protein
MSLASYTRALIVTEARRQLQERLGAGALFTSTDLERWVDLALLDIASKARCLRNEASAGNTAAQQSYTLPDDCLGAWAVNRFEYDGVKLEPRSFDQIDRDMGDGKCLSSAGTPVYYIPYGRHVKLWPVPAASGHQMRVWYAAMPDSLSADAMTLTGIGFSNAYGPAVEAYVVMRGLMLAGDMQRSAGYKQVYDDAVKSASDPSMADNDPKDTTRGTG